MCEGERPLKMRSDPVPWFGLFFSWISMMLGIEMPSMKRMAINLISGDITSVSAIAKGEADLGITTPPACATMAFRGVGPYREKMENLRAILSFPHDDRMVWAVAAELGVKSIEELKDKKLKFIVPGEDSPVGFAVEKILEAYDMPLKEQAAKNWNVSYEDYLFKVVSAGIRGQTDMVVHEGRKTPPWEKLTKAREMTFLPIREDVIDKLVKEYGFRRAILSKGMIDGAVKEDLSTLDWSGWLLFTRDDVDDDLVYLITKIVVENKHLFEMSFKGLPLEKSDLVYPIDPQEIWKNVGVPLHPAAERYYREHGHMA